MPIRKIVESPRLYLAWLLVSSGMLAAAWRVDPYIFGFAAFVGVGLSACLVLAAAVSRPRNLVIAAIAAVPSMLAFELLSTINWA